jgi:hypothetical protein
MRSKFNTKPYDRSYLIPTTPDEDFNRMMKEELSVNSFLGAEKDIEIILNRLFVEDKTYSDRLKRLLVINTPDCLIDYKNPVYNEKINSMGIEELLKEDYIRLRPKFELSENEEAKSYIHIGFDSFSPTSNREFRNAVLGIDIFSHLDYWDIGNYRQRPIKIMGYIDAILNESRLTGLGRLQFLGAQASTLKEEFAGYVLLYEIVRGNEDYYPDDQTVESFLTAAAEMNEDG